MFDEDWAVGSGFVFTKTGFILTNYHVVKGAGAVEVEFRDNNSRVPAECLAVDRQNDVAVLKVANLPEGTHILRLSAKSAPRLGDHVWTIGHPNQLKNTISWGNVNAVRKAKDLPKQLQEELHLPDTTRWIQTDAVITHGSSGGPLLDSNGEVIGMNTFIAGPQLGFALHVSHAESAFVEAKKSSGALPLPIPPDDDESALAWLSREMAPFVKESPKSLEILRALGLPKQSNSNVITRCGASTAKKCST